MIPEIRRSKECLLIPIYGRDEYCYLHCPDDEDIELGGIERVVAKASLSNTYDRYTLSLHNEREEFFIDGSEKRIELVFDVYQIRCSNYQNLYYLITYDEDDFPIDVHNMVCLPYNEMNIRLFINKFINSNYMLEKTEHLILNLSKSEQGSAS